MKQDEHRRAPRKPIHLSATFSYFAGTWVTSAGEAVTMDLSARGALIRSPSPLPMGEVLAMTLNLDGGERVQLEGRVARVSAQPDGSYDIGVAFRNLSADDQYLIELQLAKKK